MVAVNSSLAAYLQGVFVIYLIAFLTVFQSLCRAGGADWSAVTPMLLPSLSGISVAYGCCELIAVLTGIDINLFITAFGYGVLFILIYVAVLRLLFPAPLIELIEYFPGKKIIRAFFLIPERI
ncbi:MAG: hypothetical protein D3906_17065 [Candidatus Electrothrix sp. AUS1_2]|nr:hypothetical protein [Candidatus Electrothrix sp. AUS1_2]